MIGLGLDCSSPMKTAWDHVLSDSLGPSPSAHSKAGRQAKAQALVDGRSVDECCRLHTAMASLAEIVACTVRDGYRPSLYTTPFSSTAHAWERALTAKKIADAFDAEMVRLGRKERAFRGS